MLFCGAVINFRRRRGQNPFSLLLLDIIPLRYRVALVLFVFWVLFNAVLSCVSMLFGVIFYVVKGDLMGEFMGDLTVDGCSL